jgi:Ca-activated chloride channel family protein
MLLNNTAEGLLRMPDGNTELCGSAKMKALVAAIGLLLLMCAVASGQTGKDKGKPPPPFVKLNVIVTDASGQAVTDLNQDDFQILEDGVPQTIYAFARREGPLCYGLAIDNSGSLRTSIEEVVEAGRFAVSQNSPDDETFVIRFVNGEKIETVQDFSTDRTLLDKSLDTLYIDEGQSAILDAVNVAADHIAKYKRKDSKECRRALVLITDGEDRASFYTQDQLFTRLRGLDLPIFSIGFTKGIKNPRAHTNAVVLLSRLARETGGNVFFPQKRSDFIPIGKEIVAEMRAPYIISYTSSNAARDGLDRKLQVTVRDVAGRGKLLVLAARPVYKVPVK